MSCLIFGSTGLCGKAILANSERSSYFSAITTISRRSATSPLSVKQIVEPDSSKYGALVLQEKPKTVFSALATTRGAAGSAEKFVEIDYGINIEIAKAAKEAGVDTFVLITSMGASALSRFLYLKTKGRLEDDVIALKFPRTIILRPGVLLGQREKPKGFLNDLAASVFKLMHGTTIGYHIGQPINGSDVGALAVRLAAEPSEPGSGPQVQIVEAKELLEMLKK